MKLTPLYILSIFLLLHIQGRAQFIDLLSSSCDTTCISDRSDELLLRGFITQKFNKYTFGQHTFSESVSYKANNSYHLGLGFHYKFVGANLLFKLPYFNDAKYGNTKFFDLQTYFYLSRFAVDAYILSYKGYYLSNNNVLRSPPLQGDLYLRPDIRTGNYGVNFQYIFNHEKFSYRAAFIQNQCQIKSAGSWLAGFTINYTRARADSSIIPISLIYNNFYSRHFFNKSSATVVAFNGGYAYTQVLGRHFFITASLLLGMGFNYVTLKTDATNSLDARLHVQTHAILRGAFGYNAKDDFIGLQYINNVNRNNMPVLDGWQQSQAGSARLTYAHRFQLRKKTTKTLEQIEEMLLPDSIKK